MRMRELGETECLETFNDVSSLCMHVCYLFSFECPCLMIRQFKEQQKKRLSQNCLLLLSDIFQIPI